jgi:hypothetical protein
MLSIVLIALVAPIALRLVTKELIRSGKLKTYTEAQMEAMYKREYPSWYRLLILYMVLRIALPVIAGVAFIYSGVWTAWVADVMQSLLAPNAVFFNPFPSSLIVAFLGGVIIIYSGWALFSSLTLLLPKNMQAYLAHLGDKNMPHLRMASESALITNIASVICLLALIGILAALPAYKAVDKEYISIMSSYPRHSRTALNDVHMLQILCSVSKDDAGNSDAWVDVVAKSPKGDIALIDTSNSRLPIAQISTKDISQLLDVAEERKIAAVRVSEPGCAETVAQDADAKAQYEAFFKK